MLASVAQSVAHVRGIQLVALHAVKILLYPFGNGVGGEKMSRNVENILWIENP